MPQIEEMTKQSEQGLFEEDLTTPEAIMHIDEIDDWESRMDRASYTSQQRDCVRQCLEKKDKFLHFMEKGAWEVTDTNKKEGY